MKPMLTRQTKPMQLSSPTTVPPVIKTHPRIISVRWLVAALVLTVVFVGYTLAVKWLDVSALDGQNIGGSTVNAWWRECVGVNPGWHIVSNVVAVVALGVVGGLLLGQVVTFCRTPQRPRLARHWWALDVVLLALGLCYGLFQVVVINTRPLLIHGVAEASYPSSHVLLFATVFPLALLALWRTVHQRPWRVTLTVVGLVIMGLGIVARTLSGYHWLTDIGGGVLLGAVLVTWYQALSV
ncbi:MAG: phosphatase PAP2 family protein [Prevotella sp.]|nr:phosphatase PAP2 family protein [Prevotella sp.]